MCEAQFPRKVAFSRYRILKDVNFLRLQIALASQALAIFVVKEKCIRAHLHQITLEIMLLPII